ncbi:MAG: nucleotidyltransferase domain-containing protein [Alphaproteobacteria bacterium]|nr:nucleotidyltransferase domain-containing protein [Alphaproteobacteria bacterium]
MTSKVDISPDCLETVQSILRTYLPSDVRVWVFGSRSTWTAKDFSDLDLVLESSSGVKIAHETMVDLDDAFEESNLP